MPQAQAPVFKSHFSIKDLEQFSGTKAHTIRIWEKRYGLLKPQRSDTNIRHYDIEELKVLLNVAFLNNNGFKISKIAILSREELADQVKEMAVASQQNDEVLSTLKLAMLGFDEPLFELACAQYRARHGFRVLVQEVFVPLLKQVGFLWATNTICPAHEHFLSCLIRRKIEAAIDAIPPASSGAERTTVLYLPENELHELGLLFAHFLLRNSGGKVIYLGQCVPRQDLVQLTQMVSGSIRFVSIVTAAPSGKNVPQYISELRKLMPENRCEFVFSGSQVKQAEDMTLPKGCSAYGELDQMLAAIVQ